MRLLALISILVLVAVLVRGESSSASADKFTFGIEDAKQQQKQALDEAEEEALVVFETILEDKKEGNKSEAIVVKTDDDDDDGDDDDDDNDDNDDEKDTTKKDDDDEDEIDDEVSSDSPKTAAKSSTNQIRRQGDLYTEFHKKDDTSNRYPSDSDSSPLLRLTQGGYQRPYDRHVSYDNIQTQQTAERPAATGELPRPQPQVTYAPAHQQSQVDPMFFHSPFESSGPFTNADFFAARPSPYPDFRPPSNMPFRNEFQGREQNPYHAPSMVDPNLLFQGNPQFVQAHPVMADARQRPVPSIFQPQMSYPSSYVGNGADSSSSRPDYSAYFRNSQPPMNHPHFHGNFYHVLPPNGAGFNSNPTQLPNAPAQSGFARYPAAAQSNTDPKKERNSEETVSEMKKPVATDQLNAQPDKEDPVSVPFGTRIQQQPFAVPRDVYIRYPMTEAGYATEDSLPAQNGRPFPGFSSPDPYRNALNSLQQSTNKDDNSSKPAEEFSRNAALSHRETVPAMRRYPAGPRFYESNDAALPFALSDRYPFPTVAQPAPGATPACAKNANTTLCFKDPEYPRRELLYALNSDSFLLDRLVMSDQQRLDDIPLVSDQLNKTADENYVCKAEVTYGAPLRAKNTRGAWKVVVNIEGAIGGGKFIQPVRTEECRGGSGSPCSLSTDLRTRCVQKYSLQRLLAWSPEKGVHDDVFRVPVACSCQLL